jgi:hypothetical protein
MKHPMHQSIRYTVYILLLNESRTSKCYAAHIDAVSEEIITALEQKQRRYRAAKGVAAEDNPL